MQALLATIAQQPHVTTVGSPYTTTGAKQISASGQIGFANVVFSVQANKVSQATARAFVAKVTSASSNTVEFQVEGQIARAGNRDNSSSSLGIGFLAAAIVLFVVFGSLLATCRCR